MQLLTVLFFFPAQPKSGKTSLQTGANDTAYTKWQKSDMHKLYLFTFSLPSSSGKEKQFVF